MGGKDSSVRSLGRSSTSVGFWLRGNWKVSSAWFISGSPRNFSMKSILFLLFAAICFGCGETNTGTVGAEQDDIAAYIQANPNVDAGLDEIDESDDGVAE